MRIRLELITFDAGTQIRAAIDPQVVSDYAEAMTDGATFPPIVLFHDGNQHYLADGFHRFMAAQRLAFVDFDADVRPGTKEDAIWFALGANKANGKRLTEADKRNAIIVALQTWGGEGGKGSHEIAAQVGCTAKYVRDVEAQQVTTNLLPKRQRVTGRDGKSYPASYAVTSRPAVEQHPAVAQMIADGYRSMEIADALKVRPETVARVRREMGVGTIDRSRAAVDQRAEQMRQMAAEGHTSRQIAAAVGLTEDSCRLVLKQKSIDVPADRAVGKVKRHDSNRIVERMVMDAENLTADVNLIAFNDLDRELLASWLKSLTASRDHLGAFIRRLMKEQQKHEAA